MNIRTKGFKLIAACACIMISLFLSFAVLANANPVSAASTDSYYNVLQFGVTPDDGESDSMALRRLFSLVTEDEASEKTIYFPAGQYDLTMAMNVTSGMHLILDPGATLYRQDLSKNMIHNVDKNGEMDATGGYNMSTNITIEGGTIDGGNVAEAEKSTDVVRIDHASNITIKDVKFKHVYDCHLLELIGVKNAKVENCSFSGFRFKAGKSSDSTYAREAIQLESAWTNNPSNLKDESSYWARGTKIDGTSCENVTVSNCKFINYPCGVGQHRIDPTGKHLNKNIVITGCTLTYPSDKKVGKHAISCANTKGLTVTKNKITGPYRLSIYINKSSGVKVDQNTISGCRQNSITCISGSVTSISGNTINNTKCNAISVVAGTVKKVEKNKITNAKEHGYCMQGGKVISIKGNIINKCPMALSVSGGKAGTSKSNGIIGNTITNCKRNGITISGKGKVSSISKNKLTNVKKNGISMTGKKARVKYVLKNKFKKIGKHKVWNGLPKKVKVKIKGN